MQAEAASDELMLAEELAADTNVRALQQELVQQHSLLQQHIQQMEQLQVCFIDNGDRERKGIIVISWDLYMFVLPSLSCLDMSTDVPARPQASLTHPRHFV